MYKIFLNASYVSTTDICTDNIRQSVELFKAQTISLSQHLIRMSLDVLLNIYCIFTLLISQMTATNFS